MWHGVGEPYAALTVLRELPRGAEQLRRSGGEGEALALGELLRAILAGALHQPRFIVIEIQMRRRAGQVQVNHAPRLGGKRRLSWRERIDDRGPGRRFLGRRGALAQERRERHGPQTKLAI